ncbi:MAG: glycosyltransferase family 9 protein [Bdellovibrionota bacterium]
MKIGILHTAFIGDVILSGLLVEAIHAAGHEIIYFTKKNTCIIFAHDVRVKKVVEIHKGKGLGKIFAIKKIAAQIQKECLDVLIVPHKSATSTLCATLANVKQTIGFENAALSFLYSNKVPFEKNAHECVRYLALLKDIVPKELLNIYRKLSRPVLKYNHEIYSQFDNKFADYKFNSQPPIPFTQIKENFFILAVGSVWKTKKYPIEYWTEVAFQFLLKHENYYCVLTGGGADEQDANLFIKLFYEKCISHDHHSVEKRLVSAVNLFSLLEFALFTSYAKFVLSNDSSPVHFASAFNVPVLAVFGPTVPEFGFAPTSSKNVVVSYVDEAGKRLPCQPCSIHGKNVCPKGHFKCMKNLKPETVMTGVEKLLHDNH